jgi:hypothetical protein
MNLDLGQLQNRWDELLLIVGAIGVACEGAIASLLLLVGALRKLATWGGALALAITPTWLGDDHAFAAMLRGLDRAAEFLDRIGKWIPRLRTGGDRRAMDPRGTAAIGLFLALGLGLSGCGGTMHSARTALEYTAIGVHGTDAVLDETVVRPDSERCLEGLHSRELVGWDAYEDCMRRARAVNRGILAARGTLVTVQTGLDAVERSGDGSKTCEVIEPLASVLPDLSATLAAAGVELPSEIATYSPLIAGAVRAACGGSR